MFESQPRRFGRARSVSMKDIAERVGVSISLVSKVLSQRLGTTGVSEKTARRIREVAAELGYNRNASALALLRGRHSTLGVYIHRQGMLGSGYIDELLDGIASVAHSHRQRLSLNFYSTAKEILALSKDAHLGTMDGLLLAGIAHSETSERLSAIYRAGLPIVTLHENPFSPEIPNIGMDQDYVGQLATEHLISRGSRRIAHIVNIGARFEGYQRALRKADILYDPRLIFEVELRGDFSHEVGVAAVRELRARGVEFDAIFAQSDQEGAGCINELSAHGVRVPEDVRVIGVDNAPFCDLLQVPLTSVSQEHRKRGQLAVQAIMALIDNEPVETVSLEPVIYIRESTR